MSNNNNAKAAMAAIVSAAQKSVGNHVNMNNNVKINNPVSSSGVKPVASQPQSSNQQKNLSDNQMIKTVAVKNMNNPEQNKIQINEKQISKQPYQKSPIEQITKAQEDIMKVATKALENSASKQVTASLETDFNQRMVSILCDGIRNVHNQSLDFSEKLRQRREEKQKSLCQMQTSTCDDIRALSNTCIEVAKLSIKSKSPIDFIKNQTKVMSEAHKVYTNMFSNISKTSIDIMKYNLSCSWFNSNKK